MKRDQRKPRRAIGMNAWVSLDGGFARRACRVLDLSDTGARIQFKGQAPADTVFNLALTGDVTAARRCRVVWQRGLLAGVQFAA